jgi:hypothetical protein
LYVGPDFGLDGRLAQMIAIVWVVFMYAPGLPILFPLTALNFFIIYWIDKYLLLRFFKKPKNYDEESILFTVDQMKYSFVFHMVLGAFVYSKNTILNAKNMEAIEEIEFISEV